MRRAGPLLVLLSVVAWPFLARAQWLVDGASVTVAVGDQSNPSLISDGDGGAIIAWNDNRSGNYDIYAQRVNAAGIPLWATGGVAVCSVAFDQFYPNLVSDGAGGAIVTWYDGRATEPDIYAQRVNASGVPLWTSGGNAVCTAVNGQYFPVIASDGGGGAIIAWQDARSFVFYDVYAQRVDGSGVPQWTANGAAICTAGLDQNLVRIVSDGAGGAIVAWQDLRSVAALDIYAQRVNIAGTTQWTADGVALCIATGYQQYPAIESDGVGGAIVTWQDARGPTWDIFTQRVNAAGTPQWTANGVLLCSAVDQQHLPSIATDGAGGAIVSWFDYRFGGTSDIFAQRVSASGTIQWKYDGVALCTAANNQFDPRVVANGAGSAIVTWYDLRSGGWDVYAQRVDMLGTTQWNADGVAVCSAVGDQKWPMVVADGTLGAFITWHDQRSGTFDVYAQLVEPRYGYFGHPEPIITSVADILGDQGGRVKVNWTASGHDIPTLHTITHYSVWRATDPVTAAHAVANNTALLVSTSDVSAGFSSPALRRERTPTIDYYWELVGTQTAQNFEGYTFSAPTSADSTSQGIATHHFQVLSHGVEAFTFWPSNTLSGHSVDNLAPPAPLLLAAQRVGADVSLRWNRSIVGDLRDYAIYRATASGVTPVPVNFLSNSDDTVATDPSVPTSALYYIVTAYDVHENQSAPSNEASVGALTAIGRTAPVALTVLDNAPNPFSAQTTLRIGLPTTSDVEIDVFDVAGRRVRHERFPAVTAGWRDLSFEARDAGGFQLSSGVYFYRVKAAGGTITRKMVIAR